MLGGWRSSSQMSCNMSSFHMLVSHAACMYTTAHSGSCTHGRTWARANVACHRASPSRGQCLKPSPTAACIMRGPPPCGNHGALAVVWRTLTRMKMTSRPMPSRMYGNTCSRRRQQSADGGCMSRCKHMWKGGVCRFLSQPVCLSWAARDQQGVEQAGRHQHVKTT